MTDIWYTEDTETRSTLGVCPMCKATFVSQSREEQIETCTTCGCIIGWQKIYCGPLSEDK